MVIGHSGAPVLLHNAIYSFHMPLFFIASGWFFSNKSIDKPLDFTKRKMKGIYWPYLKWSLIFLLLHNIFFYFGIINETYGEQSAYNMSECVKRLCSIVFLMRGYDHLLGTYWFMRSLLVGCLALCLCSSFMHKMFEMEYRRSAQIVSAVFILICGVAAYFQFKIPVVPNNGYREMLAVFFVGLGYYFRRKESNLIKYRLWIIPVTIVVSALCVALHPTEMFPEISFQDWLVIPVAGVSGFLLVYQVSKYLSSKRNLLNRALIYMGQRTFYIMTFHFLMFKPASYLKSCIYGMDWHVIGYMPVIPPEGDLWYWVVYSISAIVFSLLFERIVSHVPSPEILLQRK